MHHARLRSEPVEIVPHAFQFADRFPWLELEPDPFHVVAFEAKHLLEILLDLPMLELRIVEQHDARRIVAGLRVHAPARENGMAVHIPVQEALDIGHAEHVGIDDERAALVIHELWRHEPQNRKGLQIRTVPMAMKPITQIRAAVVRCDERMVLGSNEPDVEGLWPRGKALEGKLRDERPDDLLLVGMNKDAWFHHATPRSAPYSRVATGRTALGNMCF